MKVCLLFLFLSYFLCASAVPIWAIKTMNNIRRTIVIAQKAKTARGCLVLGKCVNHLPDDEINHLARIATKPNGLKQISEILGRSNFVGRYGDDVGHIILQDAYLRIALTVTFSF